MSPRCERRARSRSCSTAAQPMSAAAIARRSLGIVLGIEVDRCVGGPWNSGNSALRQPREREHRRLRWIAAVAAATSSSTTGDSIGRRSSVARNGIDSRTPRRRPAAARGSSVRARRASRRRRPRREDRRGSIDVVGRRGREDQRALRVRSGADDLREPLPVVLDQPDRAFQHRGRAAVVRLEVHAAEARQRLVREAQQAPDVGQPPAVDRLVVVADEEDAVGRRGEQQRKPELRPIEVLGLVDEQVRAPVAPRGEQGRVALEQPQRPGDQVVEVEAAAPPDLGLVRRVGPGDRARLRIALDRPPGRRRGRA